MFLTLLLYNLFKGTNMNTFLSNNEILAVNGWEEYEKREIPLTFFISEIPNLILVHQCIFNSNKENISVNESLEQIIAILLKSPFVIERYAKDTLSMSSEQLLSEVNSFKNFCKSQQFEDEWLNYANLRMNSTVYKYRIGPDFIDVIFSTSPAYFYHYSYKLTGILTVELFKFYAKKGAYLGKNTKRIRQGMFEKNRLI